MQEYNTPLTFHVVLVHEPIAITLARGPDLWPATPHNPRLAFSFALLDWAEALMLECQVALKDYTTSVHFQCRRYTSKQKINIVISS